MNRTEKPIGLYLHTPFCNGKCPYCDFYSMSGNDAQKDAYLQALGTQIACWGKKAGHPAVDTVYFGGGTPTLMGERLVRILEYAKSAFLLIEDAEITVEANPSQDLEQLFLVLP